MKKNARGDQMSGASAAVIFIAQFARDAFPVDMGRLSWLGKQGIDARRQRTFGLIRAASNAS